MSVKREKKQPIKPTGTISGRTLNLGFSSGELTDVTTFKFPSAKEEAERVVMQEFAWQSQLCTVPHLIPIIEDFSAYHTIHGPDFSAHLRGGLSTFWELFEVAPLSGPYEESRQITIGEWVSFAVKNIDVKISKYQERSEFRPIHLLIYATRLNFMPYKLEMNCLSDELNGLKNDVFKTVHVISFNYLGKSVICKVWPSIRNNYTKSRRKGYSRWLMIRPTLELARVVHDETSETWVDATVRVKYPIGTPISELNRTYPEGTDPIEWFLPMRIREGQ